MSKLKEQIIKSIDLQNGTFIDKDSTVQPFQPRNAYLLPKEDGTHERWVTDDYGRISKQKGGGDSYGIQSIIEGDNINIDNSDAENPVISASFTPTDTLNDVVNRGNFSTKPIIFNIDQSRVGELNFNKNSYSYYFGNYSNSDSAVYNNAIGYNCLNSVTTGQSNSGYGSYTMQLLTTGEYNASFGGYSLIKLVSGRRNSAFGNATGINLTTGSHNTILGIGALPNATTSNSNIAVGDNSLPHVVTKGNNIGIGKDTGAGGEAAHCVYIGSRAGTNNTINGVLAIHNWQLTLPNTGVGSYAETVAQMNVANSLIYGNFIRKFLKINGSFSLNPSFISNATGDSTYTKNIVAKPDGTFGWTDGLVSDKVRFNLSASITPTPNTLVPKTDGSGLLWYDNNSAANELFYIPQNWVLGRTPNNSYNYNIRIGVETMTSMTSMSYGENNVGIGRRALEKLTTGSYNTAIGNYAGNFITTSDNNVFLGASAGLFNTASNNLTNISNSVYIGNSTVGTENAINETVIGYNARGNGSNTVTLGHTTILNTYLRGKVNLNNRLKLASYTKTQRDALTDKEVGDMIWQTDAGNSGIRVFNGTNWLALQTTID